MSKPAPDADLLDAIYRGVTDAAALEQALEGLAERYRCRGATLVMFDRQAAGSDLLLTTGAWDEKAVRRYLEFAALDPAPLAFSQLPRATASTTSRMFSSDMVSQSPFANEFYYPLGFEETLGACLFSDHARFALLGLVRGVDRSAFEDDEIADLEHLLPHIVRAFQLRREFLGLETKAAGFQEVVERLEAGVVFLNAAGVSVFANRAARAVFGRDDGLALDRMGHVLPTHPQARRRLEALVAGVGRGEAGGTMTAPRTNSRRAYAILVAPSAAGNWLALPRESPTAIMLIHDPMSRPVGTSEVLRLTLGLTASAAKLVAALVDDADLKSFAEREGVTIHTARFHLHTALTRTETKTQAELVRLAVRLLRDFALRGDA
ncbi:MAG: hypothetical protein JOZ40_09720 [Methylobacteriaceae bacterium]|nr:hypothetical protein [Methylobacteriaceae bacterium]